MLGEKRPAPTRDFTPLLSVGEDMLNDMTKKKVKMEEVIDDAGQIAGYLLGLPSVQARRIRQAIEDGDPYGAIVGRK